jgi:hypothetical protein
MPRQARKDAPKILLLRGPFNNLHHYIPKSGHAGEGGNVVRIAALGTLGTFLISFTFVDSTYKERRKKPYGNAYSME